MKSWIQKLGLAGCAFGVGFVPQLADADAVADFYKGKTITMVVAYNTGGGYDTYARLVARYWPEHIPGKPNMVVQNMPGADGHIGANYVAKVAAKDGTAIGMISGEVAARPLLRPGAAKFKGSDFAWIGSPNGTTGVCVSWHTAPVKTIEDAKKTEVVVGAASGANSNTYTYARIVKDTLGVKFKIVAGYAGTNGLIQAMQNGEIQAFCGNVLDAISARNPEWIKDRTVNVLVQLALHKNPRLPPEDPLIMDLVKGTKYYDILNVLVGSQSELGRPFLAPAGVPQDRLAALRDSFAATMNSDGFRAQAKKMNLDVDPVSGKELQAFADKLYALPPDVIQQARRFLGEEGKK